MGAVYQMGWMRRRGFGYAAKQQHFDGDRAGCELRGKLFPGRHAGLCLLHTSGMLLLAKHSLFRHLLHRGGLCPFPSVSGEHVF